MKVKLPTFNSKGKRYAVLALRKEWGDYVEAYAVSEDGERKDMTVTKSEFENMEVRVFEEKDT